MTPALIGVVSLVGRRWGPTVSGWLVGLPLTSGPVALFLALELGNTFASRAAQGTLTGLISVATFCLAYSWLAPRLNWLPTLLLSWGAFFVLTFVLERFSLTLLLTFVVVIAVLALVLKLLPRGQNQGIASKSPRWETPLRMLVATAFVLVLTGVASILGPQLSGLLTPFPIYASILAVFTHRFQSAAAAGQLLRGVVTGSFTFATFFLVVSVSIERWGIAVAFGLAMLTALVMHGGLLWLLKRYATGF